MTCTSQRAGRSCLCWGEVEGSCESGRLFTWRGNWSECTSILEVTIALEPHGESSWSPHLSCNLDPVCSAPRSFSTKSFTLEFSVLCTQLHRGSEAWVA